jgi:hypothetical protein
MATSTSPRRGKRLVETVQGGSCGCGSPDIPSDQRGNLGHPSIMNDPRDIALYAAELVSGERQDAYGHPLDNFTRASKIWAVILGCEVSAEQVALCMVGMKVAREVNQSKPDTVVDGIGYFLTLNMIQEERLRRENN